MAMHDGLDLSRFKKVSSDKKTTVLRHKNGHELKIASSTLTPKMRESIDSLPQHEETQDVKRYAEGTPDEPVATDDPAPVAAAVGSGLDAESPEPPPAENQTPVPTPQPHPQSAVTPPPAAAAPAPQTPQTQQAQAPQPPAPEQTEQQLNNDNAAFASDLSQGHIQPKTYQDLYNSKDTLGKIGTLFGLLLSGAGSGLTHQPNAVMGMMDKEIERDLEAQKQSATNKQTWYSAGLAHQLNQAKVEQMGVENINTLSNAGLTQAQTKKIPEEVKRLKAETGGINADTRLKGIQTEQEKLRLGVMQGLNGAQPNSPPSDPNVPVAATLKAGDQAKNHMQMAAIQNIQDTVINKMAEGPQKLAAQNLLNTLSGTVMSGVAARNKQTAQKIAAVNAMSPPAQPVNPANPAKAASQDDNSGVDMDRLNELGRQVQLGEFTKLPANINGVPVNADSLRDATEQAGLIRRNRELYNIWDKSFQDLAKLPAGGKLEPAMRDAKVELVASEILKQMGAGHSMDEAKAKANAMFPDWKDMGAPGARKAKYNMVHEQFKAAESPYIAADRLGISKPFPEGTYGKAVAKDRGASGSYGNATAATGGKKKYPEGYSENGWVVEGGQWQKQSTSTQAKK